MLMYVELYESVQHDNYMDETDELIVKAQRKA